MKQYRLPNKIVHIDPVNLFCFVWVMPCEIISYRKNKTDKNRIFTSQLLGLARYCLVRQLGQSGPKWVDNGQHNMLNWWCGPEREQTRCIKIHFLELHVENSVINRLQLQEKHFLFTFNLFYRLVKLSQWYFCTHYVSNNFLMCSLLRYPV